MGLILAATLMVGCSDHPSDDAASATHSASASATLPPDSLPTKMKGAINKDLAFSVQDATDLGRTVDLQHADVWRVCLTRKGKLENSVTFGAVPRGEKCPTHWDAHVPTPQTPKVIGDDFQHAYKELLKKGYNHEFIDVLYGSDQGAVNQQDIQRVHGQVCHQYPKPGQPLDASENVKLYVALKKCPRT
ncbi:PASTA domain-containing protein [Streptomyces sp. NPDC051322]|uniref:PASTA domain-containing protein n=1 Tax=Streptomyces sp. NPDC051322 TaxID=3154645 RepID=UPI00344EC6EE